MKDNKEISALLSLIDDPDQEVYNTISEKIVSFGKDIIPHLENLWENVHNEDAQERIELLIHRLHFSDLTAEFIKWRDSDADLLQGAIIVAKYHYPDMNAVLVMQELEKLRRNIWLELNSYLTPMEKANVFNSIIYNYYKLTGIEISYESPETFLINRTLEGKKGNAMSNGIIYLVLCELLDIPVKALSIPRQFILGYFDQEYQALNPVGHSSEKIKFYIDPLTGQMYSHKDIENYFKRLNVPPVNAYFRPMNNRRIIQYLLEELSKCFDNTANHYKMDELLSLAAMLDV